MQYFLVQKTKTMSDLFSFSEYFLKLNIINMAYE